MLVKDKWQLTRVETSLFTLLPMALTLPAFLLTTFIPCNLYVKLLIGMFVPTLVAIMPFVHNLYAMGFIIFSCELANSMRLAAMTPILNSFMNGKQTTIRLVSVVTLLSFVYKTIGLSLGAYLFTIWEPFPFIAAGLFQVTNAMGILSLKPYIDHQMSKESAMERKTLLDHHWKLTKRKLFPLSPKRNFVLNATVFLRERQKFFYSAWIIFVGMDKKH